MKKLTRAFYNRPTLKVAEELLGKVLFFKDKMGIITETEAYCGFDDPASHAAKGKTPRSAIMFGKSGFSYVYFIYGMYHCLNVVTEKEDYPAAVLIRGIQLITDETISLLSKNFKNSKDLKNPKIFKTSNDLQNCHHSEVSKISKFSLLNGPGKLCRYLGISKQENAIDMTRSTDLYIASIGEQCRYPFIQTPRIGIKVGQDKLWRFVMDVSI